MWDNCGVDRHTMSTVQPSRCALHGGGCIETEQQTAWIKRRVPCDRGYEIWSLTPMCQGERRRRRRRSRPYGPEEGTVIWLHSVRKCKCLCSDVYTFWAWALHCLSGCLLCHKELLVHLVRVEVSSWRLAGPCFLLSVCQLLLPGVPRPLSHRGLACKLSAI